MPFYVVGSTLLSLSALSIVLMPNQYDQEKEDAHALTTLEKHSLTTWTFLKVVCFSQIQHFFNSPSPHHYSGHLWTMLSLGLLLVLLKHFGFHIL